jgi:hypothetical protein
VTLTDGIGGKAMATAVAPRTFERVETPPPLMMAMASLSAAAAVIHFVMVPSHMEEFATEGIAFAVAGWLQLLMAFYLWTQPSRALLGFTAAVNLAFIGVWVVSRTAGLPVGPSAGVAEEASLVDVATVSMEAALVLLAVAVAILPRLGEIELPAGLAMAVPLAVAVVTSAVVASPEARNHAHAHDPSAVVAAAPAAAGATVAADGHVHGGAAAAAATPVAVSDEGLSLLSNGHHHAITQLPMSPATQLELKRQLAITREVAARYPTVADAEAAGYRRAGPYSPGLGTHYTITTPAALNFDGVVDDNDLRHPLSIIYDGSEPDSPVAGFMYYATTSTAPQGFASENDVWHYHEQICLSYADGEINAPFGADLAASEAQCSQVGGFMLDSTQYMVHVWSVPGYDNVDGGVFAEVNPALDCADGTYWRLPASEWPTHLTNVCEAGAA